MAYQPSADNSDFVSGEQYRYALTNFRIAHEKVEEQRGQLQQQERQTAQLRERIAVLEGTTSIYARSEGGSTVDDFTIKNAASQLERLINRWASEVLRRPPAPLSSIHQAVLADLCGDNEVNGESRPIVVQSLLRHALAETISESIVNCLVVTNSGEANVQLTRIHEHIFARDPTVASVWRRQTFSAAVETVAPSMTQAILAENLPSLSQLLGEHLQPALGVLDAAIAFSRTLHGSPNASVGTLDSFYRSFVPEFAGALFPAQVELVKRCIASERGEFDRVGATIFPGLVKVSKGAQPKQNAQTIVRRALVICECALMAGVGQKNIVGGPGYD